MIGQMLLVNLQIYFLARRPDGSTRLVDWGRVLVVGTHVLGRDVVSEEVGGDVTARRVACLFAVVVCLQVRVALAPQALRPRARDLHA